MQQQIELEVAARDERGKNAARRLRATGRVPAIVYGLGAPPQAVAIDSHQITNVLKQPAGHNRVFNLQSNGGSEHAMAVDYQIDPVKHSLLHVDLRRVDLAKPVTVSVPISAVGIAVGVKNEGGFEEMVHREVKIECLPLEIPEQIDVAVDDLQVGQSIRVKDIPPSDRYKVADDAERLLLHIMASRASSEEVDADEDEEDAEPAEGEPAE